MEVNGRPEDADETRRWEQEKHPAEDVPMRTCSCASKRPPGPGDTCSKCTHAKSKHRPDYRGCTERVPVDSVEPFLARGGLVEDKPVRSGLPEGVNVASVTYAMPQCPPAGTLLRSRQGLVVQVLDPNRTQASFPPDNAWPSVDPQLGIVAVAGSSGTIPWFEVLGRYGPLTTIGFCELRP